MGPWIYFNWACISKLGYLTLYRLYVVTMQLIVALLDCSHSQDAAVATLSVTLFGEMGALDYYRMKLKSMERRSRRDPREIFTTGAKFALRLFEILRKQYQGTELSVPEDVDICAYSIQELLRIYRVNIEKEESLIWKGLTFESQVIFQSLLTSLYCIKDVDVQSAYPSPLYGSMSGRTFQDWCNNFILKLYTFMKSSQSKEIIRCTLPILVRSLPVATHLLPVVAGKNILVFYASTLAHKFFRIVFRHAGVTQPLVLLTHCPSTSLAVIVGGYSDHWSGYVITMGIMQKSKLKS